MHHVYILALDDPLPPPANHPFMVLCFGPPHSEGVSTVNPWHLHHKVSRMVSLHALVNSLQQLVQGIEFASISSAPLIADRSAPFCFIFPVSSALASNHYP